MSNQTKPIISFEGTSILYRETIDLSENNLSGTRRSYHMRDWGVASVEIQTTDTTVSGTVSIKQSLQRGGGLSDLRSGAQSLSLNAITGSSVYGLSVDGAYLVLDFTSAVFADTGRVDVIVLGKRSCI